MLKQISKEINLDLSYSFRTLPKPWTYFYCSHDNMLFYVNVLVSTSDLHFVISLQKGPEIE